MYIQDGRLGRQVGRLTGFGLNIDRLKYSIGDTKVIWHMNTMFSNRAVIKYRLSAMYIIYDTVSTDLPKCRPISHPDSKYR